MGALYKTALTFVIIGAINWGLIGFFNFNLISAIFGADTFMTNLIYSIVGVAGILSIPILAKQFDEDRSTVAYYNEPKYQMEVGEEFDFADTNTKRVDEDDKNQIV